MRAGVRMPSYDSPSINRVIKITEASKSRTQAAASWLANQFGYANRRGCPLMPGCRGSYSPSGEGVPWAYCSSIAAPFVPVTQNGCAVAANTPPECSGVLNRAQRRTRAAASCMRGQVGVGSLKLSEADSEPCSVRCR